MKSTPGSARASPLHGQVKFVPSMRNVFSLVPDPNADTLLVVPFPGDVGDTPGAALMKSNMLNRRTGMALRSSGPKRVSNPLPRASIREPAPSTTSDSSMPADLQNGRSLDRRACPDADVRFVIGLESLELDIERVESRRQDWKAQTPSLVRGHSHRAANQRRRADADRCAREDAALFVLHGSDECSGQSLRGSHVRQQGTPEDEKQHG